MKGRKDSTADFHVPRPPEALEVITRAQRLAREGFANASKLNMLIKAAFAAVQMPQYTPHAFRKTLTKYGDEICTTMEQRQAWSMNLGHENMASTINSYLPVTPERQMELIRNMGR